MSIKLNTATVFWVLGASLILFQNSLTTDAQAIQERPSVEVQKRLVIEADRDAMGTVSRGDYRVFENREAQSGREIKLKIIIFHATDPNPKPDPVFILAGGPGQGAADVGLDFANSPLRKNRDVVLVNQRGTGGDNRLSFPPVIENGNTQQDLGPLFDPVRDQFLKTGTVENLDTRCVKNMKLPPLYLPKENFENR